MGQRRNLEGLRVLVTGASQGIGRSLVLEAAKAGMRVMAAARTPDLLAQLKSEADALGKGEVEMVVADVTSPADRATMVKAVTEAFGGLDILVNNAGIGATGHFAEANQERLRKIFEVNVFGLTETTRVFLPMLKKGKTPAIVNISSVAGIRGIPARSDYSASKFAIEGFSMALRNELSKDGVDVLVVCPGLTQTNFSHNMLERKALLQMDHMRGMTSEEVARETLKSMQKGRDRVLLTRETRLISMVTRFLPWLADRIAKKKVRNLFVDEMAQTKKGNYPAFLNEAAN